MLNIVRALTTKRKQATTAAKGENPKEGTGEPGGKTDTALGDSQNGMLAVWTYRVQRS